jgi:hypothetical protein
VSDGGAVTAKGGAEVGPNGTVMGDGTLTTPVLINNGKVTPTGANGTPGTLTLNGNYTQNSSGILKIQFASGSHGLLAVDGRAFLRGTLRLSLLNGFVPPSAQRFTILTAAAGVDGTFNLVQQPTATVFTVFYDPKDVQVEVEQVPFQNLRAIRTPGASLRRFKVSGTRPPEISRLSSACLMDCRRTTFAQLVVKSARFQSRPYRRW